MATAWRPARLRLRRTSGSGAVERVEKERALSIRLRNTWLNGVSRTRIMIGAPSGGVKRTGGSPGLAAWA